jgi:hypothetical protein
MKDHVKESRLLNTPVDQLTKDEIKDKINILNRLGQKYLDHSVELEEYYKIKKGNG